MAKLILLRRKTFSRLFSVFFCVAFAGLSPNLIGAQAIEWKVKDPFRLIDYSKPGTEHWRIQENESASKFVLRLMASGDRNQLPPYKYTRYIRDDENRTRPLFDRDYVFPQYVQVSAWLSAPLEGECDWVYGGKDGKGGTFNCDRVFEFDARTHLNPGPSDLVVKHRSTGREIAKIRIVVKDRLVLGLGDSFASGEGNPDKPAEADPIKLIKLADKNKNKKPSGRWMGRKPKDAETNWLLSKAEWLDNQCHRSLFSQHVLAAMLLSAANQHESVTLLPLACSGAEVLDGLLIAQQEPPGGGGPVVESQVNSAIRHLCKSADAKPRDAIFHRGSSGSDVLKPLEQKVLRCEGGPREPDAILLSIGGNDVGFAYAVAWAAIPYSGRLGRWATGRAEKEFPPVCPSEWEGKRCGKSRPPARYRIDNWLPHYYQYLMDELRASGLLKYPKRVYLTAYPDPTYKEGGTEVCDGIRSADALEQIRTMIPIFPSTWDFLFIKTEVDELKDNVIAPLGDVMQEAANKHKWTFVNEYLEKIRKDHGLCAEKDGERKGQPMYPHITKEGWYPKSPHLEWAYDTSRQRWFRNTNDSILFQYEGDEGYKKNPMKGSIKGAFHPDFRAHALMADEVFNAVSKNWYEHAGEQR